MKGKELRSGSGSGWVGSGGVWRGGFLVDELLVLAFELGPELGSGVLQPGCADGIGLIDEGLDEGGGGFGVEPGREDGEPRNTRNTRKKSRI